MGKADPKLLEMAEVFHMPKTARLKYIILPAVMPGLSKSKAAGSRKQTGGEGKEEGGA